MTRTYFGTDGIRGEANEGNMTAEVAFRLGLAVTYRARKKVTHAPRVVIGKDTRISGYLFEHAVSAGVCTMGGRVMLTGPLPTPAIAHLTTSMRADAGVMISASHNPYQDNGLKVFGQDGFKLPDDEEAELERLMHSDELNHGRPRGTQVGRAERIETAWGRYVQYIKGTFPSELTLDGIKIVVDAAHGAAYQTAPHVFYELGATITSLGIKPNGQNINFERGAMFPQHCARQVLRRNAHVGFALDGDADRVVVIDEKGRQVNGDAVMALCATRMIKRNALKQRTLVTTVMSSIGLDHALMRHNGNVRRVDVGDRYVVEAMRKGNFNFGGEQSGHLIFLDHSNTGDGTLGALQLLAIMLREQRPLSELVDEVFEAVPQVLVNVALPERRPLQDMARTRKVIEHAERSLGNDGRVLVRWSGTEPKLRVMVEGPNESAIRNLADSIADAATQELRPG